MFEGGAVGQRKMISVSTQTPRSWLRDVQVVESLKIKPLNVEKDGCTDTPLLPPLLASEQVEPKSSSHSGSEIHLPHIVPHTEVSGRGEEGSCACLDLPLLQSGESEGESYEELTAPLSMSQLADVNFFDNSDDSLEEDDQSEKPEVNESPPYPDICSSQLSWPVILQYLRESESLASQYFSLDRKPLDIQQEVRGVNNESGRRECEEHSTAIPVIERMGSICEFCGRPSPQWSVLKSINKVKQWLL